MQTTILNVYPINKVFAQDFNINQNQELEINSKKPIQIAQSNPKINWKVSSYYSKISEDISVSTGEIIWIVQGCVETFTNPCLRLPGTDHFIAELADQQGVVFKTVDLIVEGQTQRKRLKLKVSPSDLRKAATINVRDEIR